MNSLERDYFTVVDRRAVKGRADHAFVRQDGKRIAIKAKFVEDWNKSISNPAGSVGDKEFAVNHQVELLDQAKSYSNAFHKVIYHTNSIEFAKYYDSLFKESGIKNIKFVITPVIKK